MVVEMWQHVVMRRGVAVVLTFWAASALAWPVDWIHDVEAGREKFVKLPRLDWFEVEDPKVLAVEWEPESNELLLVGLKAGRTTVLLGADGKVAAWRVRVGTPPLTDDAAFKASQKACPGLKVTPLEDVKLTATVKDDACRRALLALFQTDAFEARFIELTFDEKVLQGQLRSVEEGLRPVVKNRVKARYVGAGLVLEGPVTVAEHRRVLRVVLERTLGRFALDDRLELPEPVDAGTP